ncbi:LysR family transcriptional regulator [Kiloniella laminariae]|uniref:LysR family transcriptional regulator n=1 Tax=Kiloniella laminariae TaxID=454162 RepID=A0ABT4LEF2_9PROT|nr:LysR family transcriptional regulator [Kiloniella laminariae]MCZ4279476.1 LysR family transcriptional regulator [Kiloniella laminariae]
MNKTDNSDVDLNLLRIFQAIYAERHITRAAERLGMTQSAVSHALQRLRHSLNDPLFIRAKNGVEPTARADEIILPLQQSLSQITRTLQQPSSFDPATSQRHFHYGLPDHAVARYAPMILKRFAEQAPGLALSLYHEPLPRLLDMIEDQRMDMAACVCRELPPRFRAARLFKSRHLVIAAHSHPEIQGSLSLDQYLAARHIIYSGSGKHDSYVDSILQQLGHKRHVAASIASHMASPVMVADSDLIATTTMELAGPFIERYQLQHFEVPFAIPDIEVQLIWHQRHDRDPGHIWLRDLTFELTRDV